MRLTLRTLLAYLDNLLEPADAAAISAKIEESETASELVHRIREVTKKVRLAAPPLDGKGLGLDLNTVAEYLDNELSGERTPDFEMVCLESDVHLAEVAACHEILSLVLEKKAEIDPATRQRMYALINEPAPASKSGVLQAAPIAVPVAAPVAPAAPSEERRKREVPAYLRQTETEQAKAGRGWVLAAVALAALLLTIGAVTLAIVPIERLPEPLRPLAQAIFPRVGAVVAVIEPEKKPPVLPPDEVKSAGSTTATAATTTTSTDSTAAPSTTELRQPPSAVTPSASTPAVTTTGAVPPLPAPELGAPAGAPSTTAAASVPGVVPPPPADPALPATPSTGTTPSSTAPASPAIPPAAPNVPAASPPGPASPGPAMPNTTGAATTTPPAAAPLPDAAVPATPSPAVTAPSAKIEPVGKVNSPASQVLLRYNVEKNAWTRIAPRESLSVGDRLLTLPNFRSQIALNNGLTIDMLGGTLAELLPIDATGTPGLMLLRGRLMLLTAGGTKAAIRLENGRSQTMLALATGELGVEYVANRAPGTDPSRSVPWVIQLYAKSGNLAWASPGGPEAPINVPSQWYVTETTLPAQAPQSALPAWLASDERDLLAKQAADFVELGLRTDKALSVALREMVSDRRVENVQMALACLAQLGEYDDFVPLLRDPTQRYSSWENYIRLLVKALDFGPVYAEKVRDAFVRQHGPRGEQIYRLLWGFSDEQLQGGDAQTLVELLDHEELDFRVVAYWNLCEVTTLPPPYSPQDAPLKRKLTIQKWTQKLEAGQIGRKKAS
jgi:hypothetical protein